jgi:hypothetical protein
MKLQSSTRVYALVLAAAVLLFAALTSLLDKAHSCGCEQTYMFTSYTEVPVLDPVWCSHRYRLMLYREMAHPRQGEQEWLPLQPGWHRHERGAMGQPTQNVPYWVMS